MKKNKFFKNLSLILLLCCIVAATFCLTGCEDKKANEGSTNSTVSTVEVGNGAVKFNLTVTDLDSNQSKFIISTDKKTVGEALEEAGIINKLSASNGMVTTVNGKTYDYNKDGAYWSFYEGGQYAMTGVAETKIKSGGNYELRAEKA